MTKTIGLGVALGCLLAAPAGAGNRTFDNKALKEAGQGRAVYLNYCTGCHGVDARGGTVPATHIAAPDLTLIAARDGTFDVAHVAQRIDGRSLGRRSEMPSWGRYLGGLGTSGEGYAVTRVSLLTRYLDFVQAQEGQAAVTR